MNKALEQFFKDLLKLDIGVPGVLTVVQTGLKIFDRILENHAKLLDLMDKTTGEKYAAMIVEDMNLLRQFWKPLMDLFLTAEGSAQTKSRTSVRATARARAPRRRGARS